MKHRALAALALAASSSLLSACGAPSLTPLHASGYRTIEETSDGWVGIRAPDSAIRFMMPGVPEVRRGAGDPAVTVFDLRTEANSRGFTVHLFDFGAPARRGESPLDVMEARLRARLRGPVARVDNGVRGGRPVRDLEVHEVTFHGHVAHVRLVAGGRYGVAMTMVHLPDEGAGDDDLRRFRDSLRLASREPAPGGDPDIE
jgi:hypothetical protein